VEGFVIPASDGLGDSCRLVAIGAPGDKEKKDGNETSHTRGHVRPPSGFYTVKLIDAMAVAKPSPDETRDLEQQSRKNGSQDTNDSKQNPRNIA
jgi:hypothetical protein